MEKITFNPAVGVRTYERIVDQVEEALLNGQLRAGDHLPSERMMMEQFDVSRSTVREALRVLESRGLLELRPGGRSGPRIIRPSPKLFERDFTHMVRLGESRVSDLVQLRMGIDGTACSIAAHVATPADIAMLRELLAAMEDLVDADAEEFARADAALHDGIWGLTGNELLIAAGRAVSDSIVQLIAAELRHDETAGTKSTNVPLQSNAGHSIEDAQHDSLRRDRMLVNLIEAGDGHEAGVWIRRSLWERFADRVSPQEKEILRSLAH